MRNKYAKILLIVLGLAVLSGVVWTSFRPRSSSLKPESRGVWSSVAGGDTLPIGLLVPKTGRYAAFGASIDRGAKLAERSINSSGGILGKPVELRVVDTRSDAKAAFDFTTQLLRQSPVALLIGTYGREETLAVADLAGKSSVPFIYLANGPAKTCTATSKSTVAPYVWGAGATPEMRLEPLLIELSQSIQEPERVARFFFFASDSPESAAVTERAKETATDLGFEVAAIEYVDDRVRDYYQNIRSVFNKRPDILFIAASERAAPVFINQAAKLNMKRDMTIAGLEMLEEERLPSFGRSADGFISVDRYASNIDSPENRRFVEEHQRLFPEAGAPTALTAATYGAFMLARAAFDKAGSPEPAKFKPAMDSTAIKVPQGHVAVSAENHLFIQPLYAVTINNGRYDLRAYLGDVGHPQLEGCIAFQDETKKQRAAEDD